jgi:hypothetical protein
VAQVSPAQVVLCPDHQLPRLQRPHRSRPSLIKRIKRSGLGFRRFAHNSVRVLLYAGKPHWDLLATVTPR